MSRMDEPPSLRRTTEVSLPAEMSEEAQALDVDLARACEKGLREALSKAGTEAWPRENAEGIKAWNDQVDKHGTPLAEYRQF